MSGWMKETIAGEYEWQSRVLKSGKCEVRTVYRSTSKRAVPIETFVSYQAAVEFCATACDLAREILYADKRVLQ